MRTFLALICLVVISGCATNSINKIAIATDPELGRVLGEKVTLHGEFHIAGKVGSFIHRDGKSVYLISNPSHGWSFRGHGEEEGKVVRITGILQFVHFVPAGDTPDYFYMDAETTIVEPE